MGDTIGRCRAVPFNWTKRPVGGLLRGKEFVMAKMSKPVLIGSVAGAVVLLVVLILIIVNVLGRPGSEPPEAQPSAAPSTGSEEPTPATGEDDGAAAAPEGWVAEPSTSDPVAYAEAAFRAVTTFDTRGGSRDEFLEYLGTWMTPVVYDGQVDEQITEMNQGVLRNDVLMDAEQYEFVTSLDGAVEGTIESISDPASPTENDVRQEYVFNATVVQAVVPRDGETDGWAESRVLALKVECSADVVLSPSQKPGDCKVVRWAPSGAEG
ncbi:hypothetical protein [Microbacterium thalli]|uniref:Uncharacterized protein n=1 Tax=Microbacterium thalli TaxID=3027921 RepID=A0ABT5SJU8_9MICO|nr:hypothetical protein [Microbacterium thalli]MDD7963104.1 hypothetical protein [Microbacterium thalli]